MEFNDLAIALQKLPRNFAFRIANEARTPADYKFAEYLPEMNMLSYTIGSSTMRIIPTLAGLVGMDSPYPEGGQVIETTLREDTAKIANQVTLPEKKLRELQDLVTWLKAQGLPTTKEAIDTILNFEKKLVLQAHMDTMEMLRGQAIMTGALNWTFGKSELKVNYNIPAGNFSTYAGNAGFGAAGSQFWAFIRTARRRLKNNVREYIAHSDTVEEIITNPANNLEVIGGNQLDTFKVQRLKGSIDRPSNDINDTVTLFAYSKEANVIDPARPGVDLVLPFCPRGRIAAIANNTGTSFTVGSGAIGVGATPPPEYAVGYTHLAPTVESGGAPGRWSEVMVPPDRKYTIEGKGVTNGLPVLDEPDKVVIGITD